MPKCRKCGTTFPNRVRVEGVTHVVNRRKACFACVPFKSGGRVERIQHPTYDVCLVCGGPNKSSRRRRCSSCNTKVRRYRNKEAAVGLLGGVCKDCGWSGPQAGFSFHHLSDKEFAIGMVANRSWSLIKRELKKCVLLCVRCHAIRHSDRENPRLIEEAKKYAGRELVW